MSSPEKLARQNIDAMLTKAGWTLQDYKAVNLSAARGIALREVPLQSGRCDYLLLVDRKPIGVVEAKKEGTTLSTVAFQSGFYGANLPDFLAALTAGKLQFLYESTGIETFFRDERDPHSRSRSVFGFHRPETLANWLAEPDTLRKRLAEMPFAHPLATAGMREGQIEAITNLEQSFAEARLRALIQMAPGSGKTFAACAFAYRLIKFAGAKRVLFLVDRANLGRQAATEFDQFVTPDDGRKFTELYNVQHLQSSKLDTVSRVCISTIQRLYSMLRQSFFFFLKNTCRKTRSREETGRASCEFNEACGTRSETRLVRLLACSSRSKSSKHARSADPPRPQRRLPRRRTSSPSAAKSSARATNPARRSPASESASRY